ncbi:MAG: APC family permease [Actinomycetota bacterium]
MTAPDRPPPSRLARRLDTSDAVVIGLGSMIGAGVFAAIGPAAEVAGAGLLIGLAVAAVIAYCNALSSAQLAALYPASGGTYVYGRERLSHLWGFLAGWGFLIGKTASCAAMALTFGAYVLPELTRPLAIGAVVALTAVNLSGIHKTARLTRFIVIFVLGALAVVVSAGLTAQPSTNNLGSMGAGGIPGILSAAGLLFFAFAGYARIATLGEEVKDPERTIPRAIPLALGITLAVYTVVASVALLAAGPDSLAASTAPLAEVVRAGTLEWAVPVVGVGAAVASLGVLLSLLAGVSRTTFAMASERDLPHRLSTVHPARKVPQTAELTVAAIVTTALLFADVRGAIGFSSFAVLAYYAIANASAWTLPPEQRRWPRAVSGVGLAGCLVLAAFLPIQRIVGGLALLALGLIIWLVRRWALARHHNDRD